MTTVLQKAGKFIQSTIPPGNGYGLWVFKEDGPIVAYISNGRRRDMIGLVEEWLETAGAGSAPRTDAPLADSQESSWDTVLMVAGVTDIVETEIHPDARILLLWFEGCHGGRLDWITTTPIMSEAQRVLQTWHDIEKRSQDALS